MQLLKFPLPTATTQLGRRLRMGAIVVGALAVGAAAVGTLAIASAALGALAVGAFAIKKLRRAEGWHKDLRVDRLTVGELKVASLPEELKASRRP